MISRVRERWSRWRSSLWFLPALMVLAAFLGAVGMIQLSAFVPREWLMRFPRLFGADAQSSRSMLSTIAGSMATIVGVTFSITVVAVAQASSQYTSRILRNFLSDQPSQVVLGMLAGTFVYCLVLIRTIRGDTDALFIPGLGILVAFALAILSIGFLVFFIHHIAESLQASQVLARVRRDTIAAIDRTYPDGAESVTAAVSVAPSMGDWQWLNAPDTGYLQQVDGGALVAWACRCDAVVRLAPKIGDFVVEGTPLLAIGRRDSGIARDAVPRRADLAEAELTDACSIGAYRTVEQDASFGIQQVVDIADKALSPGINDSTTAVNAIDTLSAILIRLGPRLIDTPSRVIDDIQRLIAPGHTYEELVRISLDQLRRSASADVGVSIHLIRMLARVIVETPIASRRLTLAAGAILVRDAASNRVTLEADRVVIAAAYEHVTAAMTHQAGDSASRE
ncbi:MAG: DUF2254 domain-containing protein [Gemmatimonadota bacterium]|nr:DUF2254 domain-containing protein [Gemmatimonadota bacterium]